MQPALPQYEAGPFKPKAGQGYCLASIPAPAAAFLLAGLFQSRPSQMLVIAENVKTQEEIASDLETWGAPVLFLPEAQTVSDSALPDPEIAAERLSVARAALNPAPTVILVSRAGLIQSLPPPGVLKKSALVLRLGQTLDREVWLKTLLTAGYSREAEVVARGQFAVRGGVVDLFSWSGATPLRTEWDGDEILSLREFDADAQRSLRSVEQAEISLLSSTAMESGSETSHKKSTLLDYLDAKTTRWELSLSPESEQSEGSDLSPSLTAIEEEFFTHDFLHAPRGDWIMQEQRRELFLDNLRGWMEENWKIWIFCMNEGEERRLKEILTESEIPHESIQFVQKPLLRGFVWPRKKTVLLSDAEIFGRYQTVRALRKQERLLATRARSDAMDLSDWSEGDFVVHLNYGISCFRGLKHLPDQPQIKGEVIVLEFADQAKLYVPLEQAYLVSRYMGATKKPPTLDTLGGARWERARHSAQKAVADYAAKLLSMQAERETLQGHAFAPDTHWQQEFEESFFYEETPDQLKAIAESKQDMESPRPMDRLICGDVGFGKTEVAIRAIFKAVMDGKQAAFLVPTTVLAQQHYNNLCERFADYPIRIDLMSRFRTAQQQKTTAAGLTDGSIDVVIGTHRLLSKDVQFKRLGLVAIDEEQRFGVLQKEKFKELFRLVDVLTLSATPIPRTLYLSLTGARDMSTIETPPPMRQSVETIVSPYDERVIKTAIERELARGGQVYFLHNRILTIHNVAARLKELVPKLQIDIGHGEMDKGELEEVMQRFVSGQTNLLLATSIIENGLDIPNANTIIIDRADRFGLADLYQLRGRVGRSNHKAYAYLLLPRHLAGVGDAKKRLTAMRQYSALGSGFKIAMRDLEIRGAGNMLGTAQSGHITAIGFDLYCHLLKRTVQQLKGEVATRSMDCKVSLDFITFSEAETLDKKANACLPVRYMKESRWRIDGYRRVAELNSPQEIEALKAEWKDRFGAWPEEVELLLLVAELKLLALERKIHQLETLNDKVVMKRGMDFIMIGGKFPRLTREGAKNKLLELKQWLHSSG